MPLHTLGLILLAIGLTAASVRMIRVYLRYAGPRVVTCPENHAHAAVTLESGQVVRTSLLGAPELRLHTCSRWPERAACGQECTAEIEADPDESLARNLAGRWYEGKGCVSCGLAFHDVEWQVAKPALILADKSCMEWNRVPVQQLPEVLAGAQPLCCSCYLAAKLASERPDLVVQRAGSWKSGSREV